jgi:osmotically-inducible protein OsmY
VFAAIDANFTSPPTIPRFSQVAARARDRLRTSAFPSHRRLRCSFREGVLTLRGRVPSFYHRQTACALVADVEGVQQIDDRLEVADKPKDR